MHESRRPWPGFAGRRPRSASGPRPSRPPWARSSAAKDIDAGRANRGRAHIAASDRRLSRCMRSARRAPAPRPSFRAGRRSSPASFAARPGGGHAPPAKADHQQKDRDRGGQQRFPREPRTSIHRGCGSTIDQREHSGDCQQDEVKPADRARAAGQDVDQQEDPREQGEDQPAADQPGREIGPLPKRGGIIQ